MQMSDLLDLSQRQRPLLSLLYKALIVKKKKSLSVVEYFHSPFICFCFFKFAIKFPAFYVL